MKKDLDMKSLIPLLLLASSAFANDVASANENTNCSWPLNMPAANLLLVGEVHGTNEAPTLIGDLACASATSGSPVVVALEIPIEEQTSLDNFLASKGSDADQAALLASQFWTRQPPQDGRSSAAMLKLLRTLRAEGARINVLAVDDGIHGSSDAGMATRIRAAHSEGTNVIALLGNVHTSHEKGQRSMPEYEPASNLLKDLAPHSAYVGGSASTTWVCAPDCGVVSILGNRFIDDRNGYVLAERLVLGYDGIYGAEGTTASLPFLD